MRVSENIPNLEKIIWPFEDSADHLISPTNPLATTRHNSDPGFAAAVCQSALNAKMHHLLAVLLFTATGTVLPSTCTVSVTAPSNAKAVGGRAAGILNGINTTAPSVTTVSPLKLKSKSLHMYTHNYHTHLLVLDADITDILVNEWTSIAVVLAFSVERTHGKLVVAGHQWYKVLWARYLLHRGLLHSTVCRA